MDTNSGSRNCLYCAKELKGRKDKKFCNDGCRNTFHNDLNSPTNEIVNPVFNILKKNRSIVYDFLEKNNLLVSKEELLKAGLDFRYQTQFMCFDDRYVFFYFDVGIQESGNDIYLLSYRKEFTNVSFG